MSFKIGLIVSYVMIAVLTNVYALLLSLFTLGYVLGQITFIRGSVIASRTGEHYIVH